MNASTTTQEAPFGLTLARFAWRYGLTPDQLDALDADTRSQFAATAGLTWREVLDLADTHWSDARNRLERMIEAARDPRYLLAAPSHDLAGDVAPWNPTPDTSRTPLGAPVEAAGAPQEPEQAAEAAEPLPVPADAPKGWAELAALGPVPGRHRCHACGRPAITATAHLWRCAGHPPKPGEWGHRLDFTPNPARTCAPARCYCCRCDGYTPMPATTAPQTPENDPRRRR